MSPKIRTWLKISKRISIVSPNKETMSNIAGFHMSACDFNANYFHLHNTSRQPERRRMHDGWQRAVLLSHCDEQSLHQRDFSTRKCQVLQVISYLALAILNPSTTIEMYHVAHADYTTDVFFVSMQFFCTQMSSAASYILLCLSNLKSFEDDSSQPTQGT